MSANPNKVDWKCVFGISDFLLLTSKVTLPYLIAIEGLRKQFSNDTDVGSISSKCQGWLRKDWSMWSFKSSTFNKDAMLVWLRFSSIFTPFWISQKFWPVGSRLGTEAMIVVDNFYGKIITKVVVEQFSGIHGIWNLSFSMTIVSVDTWMFLSLCLSRGQKLQQAWLTEYEYQNMLREIFNF